MTEIIDDSQTIIIGQDPVPDPEEPEPEPKGEFPWWILIVVVAIIWYLMRK